MRTATQYRFPVAEASALLRAARILPLVAAGFIASVALVAQTPAAKPSATAPQPAKQPVKHAAKHRKPRVAAHPVTPAPQPAAAAVVEPPPNWPMNNHPAPAAVTWDAHGLHIQATNSSLQQILADVTTTTGSKIDGIGTDQRIFGNFGPGDARDVLSQLLQGSGYNIVMIGENGRGAPRQIVLSSRHSGGNAPAPAAVRPPAQDDDTEDTPEPQPEPQPQPPPPPGKPGTDSQDDRQRQQLAQPGQPPTSQPN